MRVQRATSFAQPTRGVSIFVWDACVCGVEFGAGGDPRAYSGAALARRTTFPSLVRKHDAMSLRLRALLPRVLASIKCSGMSCARRCCATGGCVPAGNRSINLPPSYEVLRPKYARVRFGCFHRRYGPAWHRTWHPIGRVSPAPPHRGWTAEGTLEGGQDWDLDLPDAGQRSEWACPFRRRLLDHLKSVPESLPHAAWTLSKKVWGTGGTPIRACFIQLFFGRSLSFLVAPSVPVGP